MDVAWLKRLTSRLLNKSAILQQLINIMIREMVNNTITRLHNQITRSHIVTKQLEASKRLDWKKIVPWESTRDLKNTNELGTPKINYGIFRRTNGLMKCWRRTAPISKSTDKMKQNVSKVQLEWLESRSKTLHKQKWKGLGSRSRMTCN